MTPSTMYDILREPTGNAYEALFGAALGVATAMTLIVHPDDGLARTGESLLERLFPFLEGERWTDRWPGTRLLSDRRVREYRYRYDGEVAALLSAAANALYSWQQPTLPEDVALYYANGTPLLGTVAHEHDAFVVTDGELLPGLIAAGVALSAARRFDPANC